MTFRKSTDPHENDVREISFFFKMVLYYQVKREGLQYADAIARLLARTLQIHGHPAHVTNLNYVYVNGMNFGKNFWVIEDRRVAVWVIHKDLQTLSDFGAPLIKIASNFFGFGIQTAVCLNFEHTEDGIEMISARISHESHDWHRS